jgi:hypothetical protein
VSARGGQPLVLLGAVAALAGAIAFQVLRDRVYPRRQREAERILYVRSGPALQRMALEFDALAADAYWIRAIQHYGGDRLSRERERRYELLYPLLDITTSLDPYFTIAYRFGAIFLSEPYPGGPGRPDQAIDLLRKGLTVEPKKWQYYHDIAFVHYWHMRDTKAAASWFQRAAGQPNAPNWLQPLAATMLTSADRASARFLWQQILRSDQSWLRQAAERSLLQLDAMDQIDQLRAIVSRFPPPPGERFTWDGLVRRRVLRMIPVDPTGEAYALDPITGEVKISAESKLYPLPDTIGQPQR